jgi:hypothetical protein
MSDRQASKAMSIVEYRHKIIETGHLVQHPISGKCARVTHVVNSTRSICIGDRVTYVDDVSGIHPNAEVVCIPAFANVTTGDWNKMVQISGTNNPWK